ncbi:5-hydroxytryptamine receptor 2A [Trichonephila clavipes]|nr:5-hydroxytryptamine receptor 2A [Trichonephila clavipes]
MEVFVATNFSDNYTEFIEFQNTSEALQNVTEDSDGVLNSTMDPNEILLEVANGTMFTEVYWLDDNMTNMSFPLGNISDRNHTNSTISQSSEIQLVAMVLLSVFLSLLILATIVGNVFVIAAIFLERNLQTVGNYLVLSLAVADLMVACLVMPMGALYEVNHEWILGPELCEIWTSGDVLCCTASILHLLAIALDRYWAVTNVDYVRQRSSNRIGLMIFLVWAVGFLVSFAPILGWKDEEFLYRIEEEKRRGFLVGVKDGAQSLDVRCQKCTDLHSNYLRSELDLCDVYSLTAQTIAPGSMPLCQYQIQAGDPEPPGHVCVHHSTAHKTMTRLKIRQCVTPVSRADLTKCLSSRAFVMGDTVMGRTFCMTLGKSLIPHFHDSGWISTSVKGGIKER